MHPFFSQGLKLLEIGLPSCHVRPGLPQLSCIFGPGMQDQKVEGITCGGKRDRPVGLQNPHHLILSIDLRSIKMAAAAAQEYTGKGPRSDQGLSLQQRLASLAKSPAPSFALATLFAVSAPFGFASPQQAAAEAAAKLQRQQQIAQAAASSPGGASSLAARLIASAKNRQAAPVRALPPFWQLAGFAALFATGGYMIDKGDSLNGSGVVTGRLSSFICLAWFCQCADSLLLDPPRSMVTDLSDIPNNTHTQAASKKPAFSRTVCRRNHTRTGCPRELLL